LLPRAQSVLPIDILFGLTVQSLNGHSVLPHCVQTKPFGQREAITATSTRSCHIGAQIPAS
jgi:hypothetical protein